MRRFAPIIFVMTVVTCSPVHAMFSLDDTVSGSTAQPFSDAFIKVYDRAQFGAGSRGEAHRFEKLLVQFKQPQEQAELEITLGIIYNQHTGLVDHRQSIAHMTQALKFDLPQIVLAEVYGWRGGSFEMTNQKLDALKDYVRGLQICLEHDLPEKSPDKPVYEKVPYIGAATCL